MNREQIRSILSTELTRLLSPVFEYHSSSSRSPQGHIDSTYILLIARCVKDISLKLTEEVRWTARVSGGYDGERDCPNCSGPIESQSTTICDKCRMFAIIAYLKAYCLNPEDVTRHQELWDSLEHLRPFHNRADDSIRHAFNSIRDSVRDVSRSFQSFRRILTDTARQISTSIDVSLIDMAEDQELASIARSLAHQSQANGEFALQSTCQNIARIIRDRIGSSQEEPREPVDNRPESFWELINDQDDFGIRLNLPNETGEEIRTQMFENMTRALERYIGEPNDAVTRGAMEEELNRVVRDFQLRGLLPH